MITATKEKVRTQKQRIRGIVNVYGYQIVIAGTTEILYEAGNNPRDSSPSQNLFPGEGAVDIDTIREWCELSGKEIAMENNDIWCGSADGEFV